MESSRRGQRSGRPEDNTELPEGRRSPSWLSVLICASTLALCFHTAVVKQPPNYRVVTEATWNMFQGHNPYGAELGLDWFKYSPLAGLAIAPFALLPEVPGLFLFLLVQCAVFFWGFWRWSFAAGYSLGLFPELQWVALGSIALDLAVAIQNAQVNVGLSALMLLGAAQYAESRLVRSGLVLSLATNLKLFPFTLALCLLTDMNRRFWLSFFGGTLLWLLLPAALLGLERDLELHRQWVQLLSRDESRESLMLDLGSFLETQFGIDDGIRSLLALFAGLIIGLGCLVLFRRGERQRLHRFLVAINGLYVLLFSYLSESPTSILAAPGIFLIGARAVEKRARVFWAAWILALALVPGFYSELATPGLQAWARAVHLKTIGYLFVSVVIVILFVKTEPQESSPKPTR